MRIPQRSSLLVQVLLFALLTFTGCRQTEVLDESRLKAIPQSEWDKLPASVFGQKPPFGKMPGIIVGITTDSWGSFNQDGFDHISGTLSKTFFERAKAKQKLFFSVGAIDASQIGGFAGQFKDRTIFNNAEAKMKETYESLDAEASRLFPTNGMVLEKYVLPINDKTISYKKLLKFDSRLTAFVIKEDLTVSSAIVVETAAGQDAAIEAMERLMEEYD